MNCRDDRDRGARALGAGARAPRRDVVDGSWSPWLDSGVLSVAEKARSPFTPGQPAISDLFVGRQTEIDRLMTRGAGQTAHGRPTFFLLEGEYGIGKSSLAQYCLRKAEQQYDLVPVYASLAGLKDLQGVAQAVLRGLTNAARAKEARWQAVQSGLARFVKSITLFGVEFDVEALKQASPGFADVEGFLTLLGDVMRRLGEKAGVKGLCLVLDEINGIASQPQFAHFLKGVVDTNAFRSPSVPVMLVLCGTQERRRELIASHEPVGRIFDVVQIEPLSDRESGDFFRRAFASVGVKVDDDAIAVFVKHSAGQPRIMHLIGDQAFWRDEDGSIDAVEATTAVLHAADELGRKYVNPQIMDACRSKDYRSILAKIGRLDPTTDRFDKQHVAAGLSKDEQRKFPNFLQRMKDLNVLRSGDARGEYVFNTRLVRTALWLFALSAAGPGDADAVRTAPPGSP